MAPCKRDKNEGDSIRLTGLGLVHTADACAVGYIICQIPCAIQKKDLTNEMN